MKIEESYRRQKELEKQLYELAKESKDDRVLLQIADQLKGIYADGFRHNYSQFFPLILEIFKEDNEYNQDYLSDNLERIRAIVEKDFFETDDKDRCKYVGLYKPLTKLADHINLEIGRRSQSLDSKSAIIRYERTITKIPKRVCCNFRDFCSGCIDIHRGNSVFYICP